MLGTGLRLLTLLLAIGPANMAMAKTYKPVHSESKMSFQGFSTFQNPKGVFYSWTAKVTTTPGRALLSSVRVSVDVASLDTENHKRDKHLRHEDFFYVSEHPKAIFKSISVTKKSRGKYDVEGFLTVRGVKKKITMPVEVRTVLKEGKVMKRATGYIRLKRHDYGISYKAPFIMPNKVKKHFDLSFDILFTPTAQ